MDGTFGALRDEAQAAIRVKQKEHKAAKKLAKQLAKQKKQQAVVAPQPHDGEAVLAAQTAVAGEEYGPGAKIEVRGLVGVPRHNGKFGTVVHYDADKGRYAVALDSGGRIALRPANLSRGCRTMITSEEYFAACEGGRSRRRDFHFTGTPSSCLLKHLLKGEGGAAE